MPKTRRQRGGVRSASLLKRPSTLRKMLGLSGTTRSKAPRAAAPMTHFQKEMLKTITDVAATTGKPKDPFKILGKLTDFLTTAYREYKTNKGPLHAALRDAFEYIVAEVIELIQQVYAVTSKTGSRYDGLFLAILEGLQHKYENLAPTYGHSPESMPRVIHMIDDFMTVFRRSAASLPIMNKFLATAKPSEFAKEVSAIILRAIKKNGIWEASQQRPQTRAPAENAEANALAALLGGLTVSNKLSQEQIAKVFGSRNGDDLPEEEGWGGNDRENF